MIPMTEMIHRVSFDFLADSELKDLDELAFQMNKTRDELLREIILGAIRVFKSMNEFHQGNGDGLSHAGYPPPDRPGGKPD